jgi:hypothetical protein
MAERVESIAGSDRELELLTALAVEDANRDPIRILVPQKGHGDPVAFSMVELSRAAPDRRISRVVVFMRQLSHLRLELGIVVAGVLECG